MKKLSFLFITLVALMGCTKHEVNQIDKLGCTNKNSLNYDSEATVNDGSCVTTGPTQYGLVIEYTATWCGPCGQWGAPAIKDLYDMGEVIAIACHDDGDPMYNATLYNSLSSCRSTGGNIPAFWIGDEKMGNAPGSYPGKMTTLQNRDPEGSTVCKATRTGNNVTVKTYTEFLKEVTGDYYYSLMINESGIDGAAGTGAFEQTTPYTPDYKHMHVLRAAYGDNCYGEKIASGTTIAGKMITKDYTMAVDPSWANELAVVVVLWKFNPSTSMYEYINAFESKF